jgi:3-oxoacyl-[acyl-carrier protein] reductase
LITGASKGIGFSAARRFLLSDNGVTDLILIARESATFSESVKALEEENLHRKRIRTMCVDLADRSSTVGVVEDLVGQGLRVDMLVNNAGYTAPAAIQQATFADFERTMSVNLYAPFTLVQELLRAGNVFELIVNVASTAGIKGRAGWLSYSASKAALIAMSEVMREELAIYGTRVVCISPGRCATDLRRKLAPDEDPSTIMQPEQVAAVLEMLASDIGRFVDSQNLVVRL